MSEQKTVRVCIAVAVNAHDWSAFGREGAVDPEMMQDALGNLADADALATSVHFVEADIPLPLSQTIQGEVKP